MELMKMSVWISFLSVIVTQKQDNISFDVFSVVYQNDRKEIAEDVFAYHKSFGRLNKGTLKYIQIRPKK